MENFILGLFSEQLSTYIHGFRKEQVNASLLTGKGEISEVHINVEPINEILGSYIPYIELASIYVSKLSFNVTSIRNIKKSPVEISIDEVHIVILERLNYTVPSEWTWPNLAKEIVERSRKSFTSYGLIERIRDNVTLDINRMYVTFQPMGCFKTRKVGPWTPPAISFVLNYFRAVTVDEYGEEGTPDDVWRHNSNRHSGRQEASRMNLKRSQNNNTKNSKSERTYQTKTNMIFKKVTFELTLSVGNRLQGMTAKETFLNSHLIFTNIPIQCHLAMHRRVRDNALLAVQADAAFTNLELVIESDTIPLLIHAFAGIQFCVVKDRHFVDPLSEGDNDYDGSLSQQLSEAKLSLTFEDDEVEISIGESGSLESSGFETDSDNEENDVHDEEDDQQTKNSQSNMNIDENWPAIVLPSEIIIVEKLCISLSVHSFSVRVKYHHDRDDQYFQYTMKGMVTELLWPKQDGKQGGFIQLSLSHFNLHEYHGNKTRTLINGGMRHDATDDIYVDGVEVTTNESSFPIMEPRDIRNDPIDLSSSFPVQTFSFKASIDVLDKEKLLSPSSRLFILHEIGLIDIEVTICPEILRRIYQFLENTYTSLDSRWFTGDWKDVLPPKSVIDFQSCTQPLLPSTTRNKDYSFSSELVNATAKFSNIKLRIPAPLCNDLRASSDIVISFSQILIILSSALPRSCLSENVLGPKEEKDDNYADNESTSNIRVQCTVHDFLLEVIPSVPYFNAKDPQKVVFSKTVTILASYDRFNDSDKKMQLYVSILLFYIQLNLDFDILAGGAGTILHYATDKNIWTESRTPENFPSHSLILSNLLEALPITVLLNVNKFDCRLWRQHVLVRNSPITVPLITLLHFDGEKIELGCKFSQGGACKVFGAQVEKIHILATDDKPLSTSCGSSFQAAKSDEKLNFQESEILSFGSDTFSGDDSENNNEHKALKFHLHSDSNVYMKQRYDVKVDVTTSIIRIDERLKNTLIMVLEALLSPDWFWTLILNQGYNGLIQENNSETNAASSDLRLDILSYLFFVDSRFIDAAIVKVKLHNITVILNDVFGANMCLVLEAANLCSGYLSDEVPSIYMNEWLSIFRDSAVGFHHSMNSQQKCLVLKENKIDKDSMSSTSELIKSFELNSYIHPCNLKASMTECGISIEETIVWNKLIASLQGYRNYAFELVTELRCLLNSLRGSSSELLLPQHYNHDPSFQEPLSLACKASMSAIDSAKSILSELNTSLSLFHVESCDAMDSKNLELVEMRRNLFLKEKQRLSAYALLSDQATFIRMASTSQSQQRIVSTTNFWRYWAVLRNKTMFIYNNPSEATPVDYFGLDGARLLALAGGNSKRRDLNRGFAVIDIRGQKRFFIAETYMHYEKWVHALSMIIQSKATSEVIAPISDTGFESNRNEETMKYFDQDIHDTKSLQSDYETMSVASSDNTVDELDNRKVKLRDKVKASAKSRMSKINAVVKNIDKNIMLNSGAFQKTERKSNAGTNLNDLNPTIARLPGSSSLKIRNLKHGEDKPLVKDTIVHRQQKMCSITGTWNVAKISTEVESSTKNEQIENLALYENSIIYIVQLECILWEGNDKPNDIIVRKSMSELLQFHEELSDALISIQNDFTVSGLEVYEGTNDIFAEVILSGKLFKGLLIAGDREHNVYWEDSIIKFLHQFINSLLSNPIPTYSFDLFVTFFGLWDLTTHFPSMRQGMPTTLHCEEDKFERLRSMVKCCENAITSAERQLLLSHTLSFGERNNNTAFSQSIMSQTGLHFTSKYSTALNDALISVMTERDEIHSQLVAERVLHVHEMDQEKRKIELLKKKLKYLEKINNGDTASAAAFFLGQEEIPSKNSLDNIERKMVQNVDAELMELCRQLSSEISHRVSSELEIIRMKESQKIRIEAEIEERDALYNEVKGYKQKIEEYKIMKNAAEEEAEKWKKSFKMIVEADKVNK